MHDAVFSTDAEQTASLSEGVRQEGIPRMSDKVSRLFWAQETRLQRRRSSENSRLLTWRAGSVVCCAGKVRAVCFLMC